MHVRDVVKNGSNLCVAGTAVAAQILLPIAGDLGYLIINLKEKCEDIGKSIRQAKEIKEWANECVIPLNALEMRLEDDSVNNSLDQELRESMLESVGKTKKAVKTLLSVVCDIARDSGDSKYCARGKRFLRMFWGRLDREFKDAKDAANYARQQLDYAVAIDTNIVTHRLEQKLDVHGAKLKSILEWAGIEDVSPAIKLDVGMIKRIFANMSPRALLTKINSLTSVDLTGEHFYVKGVAHEALHELEDAIVSYELASKKSPDCAQVWLALGLALHKKSDPDHTKEELEAYEKCVAILPRGGELSLWEATVSSNAYSNLGICRATQSPPDFEGAERALLKAVKLHPKSANAHYHLGKVYQNMLCATGSRQIYFGAMKSEYQCAINLNDPTWSPAARNNLIHVERPYIMQPP